MTRHLLYLTIILSFTVAHGQATIDSISRPVHDPAPQKLKWTIGFTGGFIYFDNIKARVGFDHTYTYTRSGFRYGSDFVYHFSKRSAIATGLHYFKIDYKANYVWTFNHPGDPHIPRFSAIGTSYRDIPVIYNFSIVAGRKIVVYSATGFVCSILKSETGSTTYEDNSVRDSEFLNSFILSLQFGIGLQYNISEKLGIKIEPQYRQFLKGFDSIMDQFPMALCGSASIIHTINFRNIFKKGAWAPIPQ